MHKLLLGFFNSLIYFHTYIIHMRGVLLSLQKIVYFYYTLLVQYSKQYIVSNLVANNNNNINNNKYNDNNQWWIHKIHRGFNSIWLKATNILLWIIGEVSCIYILQNLGRPLRSTTDKYNNNNNNNNIYNAYSFITFNVYDYNHHHKYLVLITPIKV